MRKVSVASSIIIFLLFLGCSKTSVAGLPFKLDGDGSYMGFKDLPEHYTPEQAEKDGCYVLRNFKAIGGEQSWKDFIHNVEDGKNAGIRIVDVFDDSIWCHDLFYVDGYYRVFDSGSKDLEDHKFKYMLTLKGTLSGASKSDRVTVLTDDKNLTYDDVMWKRFSNNSFYYLSISPFEIVMIE